MQTPAWRHPTGLIRTLLDRPQAFAFFQAVRLIDMWLRRESGGATLDDTLRFKNSISLRFPTGEVEALSVDGTHAYLTPAFIGFLGIKGTLPYCYTEAVAAQVHGAKNEACRAFLDCFSQRSVLLFYRAWEKCRVEYRLGKDGQDGFMAVQLALAGRTRSGHDTALPPEVAAHYAAVIGQRPVSAALLSAILNEYFAVPIRLEPFVAMWDPLQRDEQSVLGQANCKLGYNVILGARYRSRDTCVRLWLGPLSCAQFDQFLPDAPGGTALRALLALFAVPALRYEVHLILRAADVKPTALGGKRRLGYGTFLLTGPSSCDRVGARYLIDALK